MRKFTFHHERKAVYKAILNVILNGNKEDEFTRTFEGIETNFKVLERVENERLQVLMTNSKVRSEICIQLMDDTIAEVDYNIQPKGSMNTWFIKFFLNEDKILNRYIYMIQKELERGYL